MSIKHLQFFISNATVFQLVNKTFHSKWNSTLLRVFNHIYKIMYKLVKQKQNWTQGFMPIFLIHVIFRKSLSLKIGLIVHLKWIDFMKTVSGNFLVLIFVHWYDNIVLCVKEDGLKLCKSLSKICAVNDGGKS